MRASNLPLDGRGFGLGATLLRAALAIALLVGVGGCDIVGKTVDKARMKIFGIVVTNPDPESAEWVIKQAIEAAMDSNEETGWERFQQTLHSEERTPNALRGWYEGGWKRMRRQAKDYVDPDGSFKIVDFKEIMASAGGIAGYEFYLESHRKEMPTPCAVYTDDDNGGKWRIRRCSL